MADRIEVTGPTDRSARGEPTPLADVVALAGSGADPVAVPAATSIGITSVAGAISGVQRVIGSVVDSAADAASGGVRAATRRLRDAPRTTDDWGRDPELVRNAMLLAQLRWDVETGGAEHLPRRAGALIVVNSSRLAATALFTAFAISEAVDRPVRFVGRRTTPLLSAFDQRVGGLLAHPDELAGALRADELVVLTAEPQIGTRRAGAIDHVLVGAALATRSRVHPAAASSRPLARRARVEIGTATRPPRVRRGPLSELELADRLRDDIGDLLAEMGDIGTGTPLDWLPLSGMGAH
ncbi:hypothetical protein [Ilumatobacter sp.]|uniref:hypothetical protein n=1 Tax=Ilumatobacter sp. TaxID=1967498 RepID=UPI003B51D2E8